jgi:urease accessory protein UreF
MAHVTLGVALAVMTSQALADVEHIWERQQNTRSSSLCSNAVRCQPHKALHGVDLSYV